MTIVKGTPHKEDGKYQDYKTADIKNKELYKYYKTHYENRLSYKEFLEIITAYNISNRRR